jgi:PAS domain-containing protein
MTLFPLLTNVIVFVGFVVALIAVLTTPTRPTSFYTRGVKFILAGAMGVWAFVGLSHNVQYGMGSLPLDVYENYLKVLFFPLLGYGAYVARVNEQWRETERHADVLAAEHAMLMRVVDTAPSALLVIDDAGRIEFANERAKEMLELGEDPDTARYRTPAWICEGSTCRDVPAAFSCCLGSEPRRDALCSLCWPDGRSLRVLVNSTPITASDGSVSGAVVAFEESAAAAIAG